MWYVRGMRREGERGREEAQKKKRVSVCGVCVVCGGMGEGGERKRSNKETTRARGREEAPT